MNLGAYDVVIEFTRQAFIDQIKSQARIGGQLVNPPFAFSFPLPTIGNSALFNVIFDTLDVTFVPQTPQVILELDFSDSTAFLGGANIAPLNGTLTLNADLMLKDIGTNQKALQFNLTARPPTVTFDQGSMDRLTAAGIPADAIPAAVTDISNFLAMQPAANFPPGGFSVVPGSNGSLSPLVFEQLDVVICVSKNAVALCGILIVKRHGVGDPTSVDTFSDTGNLFVGISPDSFREIVFCPSLARDWASSPDLVNTADKLQSFIDNSLPPCCGASRNFNDSGIEMNRICPTFQMGHVNIDGDFSTGGVGYSVTGSFHKELSFRVTNNQLQPWYSAEPNPTIHVNIDDWAEALLWVATGGLMDYITSQIAGVVVSAIAADKVTGMAQDQANQQSAGSPIDALSVTGFPDLTIDSADVSPDGLLLIGWMNINVPYPGVPHLDILGGVKLSGIPRHIGFGTYTYPGSLRCAPKNFQYEVAALSTYATCLMHPFLLGAPLNITWWLEQIKYGQYGIQTIVASAQLAPPHGSITLNVNTWSPFPLLGGTMIPNTSVQFDYVISANGTISITPHLNGLDCSMIARCKVTDPSGRWAENSMTLQFESVAVSFGDDYDEYVSQCTIIPNIDNQDRQLPPPPTGGGDPLWQLASQIYEAVLTNPKLSNGLLAYVQSLHGGAGVRAITGPSSFIKTAANSPASGGFRQQRTINKKRTNRQKRV